MSKRRIIQFTAPVLTALFAAAACSEDDSGNNGNGQPVTTTTNTGTVPGGTGTVPGGTATTPGGTATTPGGTATTPGGTATTPGGTTTVPSGTTTVPETPTPAAMCTNTMNGGFTPGADEVDGASYVYTYGDMGNVSGENTCMTPTTHCIESTTPGTMCFRGVAADSGTNYECYGAGIGIQLAAATEDGTVVSTFDAAAAGVAGVKFTLTGADSSPVLRAQIGTTQEDAAGSAFVHDGGAGSLDEGENTLLLSEFTQPSWADDALQMVMLDITQIKDLQIQVATEPAGPAEFDFCLSNLQWVDAAGAVVNVPEQMPPTDDMDGGVPPDMGTGAMPPDMGMDGGAGAAPPDMGAGATPGAGAAPPDMGAGATPADMGGMGGMGGGMGGMGGM